MANGKCIVDAGRKWQTDFPSFRFDRSISIWIALFYLRQNDVVYVMPNKAQRNNSNYNQLAQYRISVVGTVVSAISVLASLAIALFIK